MIHPVLKTIADMSFDERAQQWAYCQQFFRVDVSSSAQDIRKGKRCYELLGGKIFSNQELLEIHAKDEVPIQAQDMVSKFAAILGSVRQTWKTGAVVGNGAEDAAPASVRQQLMQDKIWPESDVDNVKTSVFQDALVTGVPSFAWVEPFDRYDCSKPGLSVFYCPWDSIVYDSGWTDPMMGDMRRVHRIKQMTYDDIIERYSEKTGADTVEKLKSFAEISVRVASNATKQNDFIQARTGLATSSAGFINVIETVFWVQVPQWVVVDSDGAFDPLPPLWGEKEISQYQNDHPGVKLSRNIERTLWSSTWTENGLLLDSGAHWLQIGMFPCVPMVPPRIDKRFVGLVEFAADTLKEISYLKTERLQGLRTSVNNLMKIKDGAVGDLEEAERQRKKAGGTIVLAADADMSNVELVTPPRPSTAFEDALSQVKDDLSVITVERNFEGGQQASQESSKAIGARISQGLNKLSFWFQGQDRFDKTLSRLIVKSMPYCLPDSIVLRSFDPNNGDQKETKVNEPVIGWNGSSLEVVKYKNDLSDGDFDFVYTNVDNSVSAKDMSRQMFIDFLKNYGNMPQEVLPQIAVNYPCVEVQNFGKMLLEDQKAKQNQAPQPPPAKIALAVSSKDIPMQDTQAILQTAGIQIPQTQPQPQTAQSQQAPPSAQTQDGNQNG